MPSLDSPFVAAPPPTAAVATASAVPAVAGKSVDAWCPTSGDDVGKSVSVFMRGGGGGGAGATAGAAMVGVVAGSGAFWAGAASRL